jgi:TolA-binding protein
MRSDVAQQDTLFKLWGWFETNKKQLGWGSAIAVVVGFGIFIFVSHQTQKEVDASEAVAKISMVPHNPALDPSLIAGETAQAYLHAAGQYPDSTAAGRALLLAAGNLFEAGKYPEALTQFRKFIGEHHDSQFMGEALLGIASCLDAQGKTSDAVTAYKDLIDHHPGASVVPFAKFALAGLYAAQNKPELARGLYEDVERSAGYGSLGPEAGMRLEELMLKFPSLAPAPAPPPVPATPVLSTSPMSKPAK